MSEIANSMKNGRFTGDDGALELRILRNMIIAVSFAVIVSAGFAPWRVTNGLLLGGVLALLNHHWLRTSIAAAFMSEDGKHPRVRVWRYLIRYVVIGAIVFAAYKLNLISLPATIAGLSAFVAAVFAEAFRSFYLIMFHREEY